MARTLQEELTEEFRAEIRSLLAKKRDEMPKKEPKRKKKKPNSRAVRIDEWKKNKSKKQSETAKAANEKRKQAREFYMDRPWRELRYQALKKYGRECACCGAHPGGGIVLHVDHIKPRSKYPELELDINNLQILCEDCNLGKSNTDEIQWR